METVLNVVIADGNEAFAEERGSQGIFFRPLK